MKRKLVNVLFVLLLLGGVSLLLYPTVSNYFHSIHQTQAILEYAGDVDRMEEDLYQTLWQEAEGYNRALAKSGTLAVPQGYEESYYSMLDASGRGVMAYVEIPRIEVTLPIMHGTSEDVLNKAVGHLEWSSLPVGGESTHCVISGHRGLPSSELFTNLDHLEIGDSFSIHVLGQTLEYRVDAIHVVLPNEYDLLRIVEGEDYVTLLTCTPYGINSHRLLVRGIRVEQAQAGEAAEPVVRREQERVDLMVVIPVLLAALSALVILVIALSSGKKRKGRKKDDNEKK